MMKDITIGQYFPGTSPIHKLDPRLKLILTFAYILSVFFCKNFVSLALITVLLFVVICISKISFKMLGKSLKPIIILVVLTSLLQILYTDTGTVLLEFWKIKITSGGLFMAFFTTMRIILLVASSSMLTYTTSPTLLTDAIERLFSPLKVLKINVHSIAMMMTIALRFIPTLIDEVDKIMAAQKARGAELDTGNIIQKGKAMVPIFVPLFINAFTRAYDLAFAMECRCYKGGDGRTALRVMKFRARDYIAIAVLVVFLSGIIVANHFRPAVI